MLYKLFDKIDIFSFFFGINSGHVKVCVWWVVREREEREKEESERERVCLIWKWNSSHESA